MTNTPGNLELRHLQAHDIQPIAAAFAAIGWNKPETQYQRYLEEQEAGHRTVILALQHEVFTGYLTINWAPEYPPFRAENIPEIQDFNVLPHFRRQGIGARLMEEAERLVARHSAIVGIGVGMYPDYGAAQRLYVLRGYIPDGRGLVYHNHPVSYGQQVPVDDGLVLYFTKALT